MVIREQKGLFHPGFEDILRAVAYLVGLLWTIIFICYPPTAFVAELDFWTRVIWLIFTALGSLAAFLGAITKIDLKLEFPGILFLFIGPLFYFVSQGYLVLWPSEGVDPTQRYALVVYTIWPFFLLLPHAYHLWSEGRRLKRITTAAKSRVLREELNKSQSLLRSTKGDR